jgi:hypothetical protein
MVVVRKIETRGRNKKPLTDFEREVFTDVLKTYISPADIMKKYQLGHTTAHRIYDLALKEIKEAHKLVKSLLKIESAEIENEIE